MSTINGTPVVENKHPMVVKIVAFITVVTILAICAFVYFNESDVVTRCILNGGIYLTFPDTEGCFYPTS